MKAARIWLVAAMLVSMMIAPAAAADGYAPDEAGVSAFYDWAVDIDRGDLQQAGVIGRVAWELWHPGPVRVDIGLEAWLSRYFDYAQGTGAALTPSLRVYYADAAVQPYIEGGFGPSLTDLDIPELGTHFNFLSYGGLGVRFEVGQGLYLDLGGRVRHISNAGMDDDNHGVTAALVMLGLVWTF